MKINSIQWVLDQHQKTGLSIWDLALREESAETGADEAAIRGQLQTTLEAMEIQLVDHLVFADRDFTSMRQTGLLR